jgi:2-polyprenyl-6-hydroxyphenyl methylase/3-demethylubiquinone-9 3-methyltransferase
VLDIGCGGRILSESLARQGATVTAIDVNSFIRGCNALVKPQGTLFIASINRNWLAFIIAIFGAEYVTGLLPKGTYHYSKLVKPAEIIPLLNADGFELTASTGVAVNPIKRSMKLIKPTWVNYMLAAQKLSE